MRIELTEDEFTGLLIMMGYATFAAMKNGDEELSERFLRVANAVNRDNPRWQRYEIESAADYPKQ